VKVAETFDPKMLDGVLKQMDKGGNLPDFVTVEDAPSVSVAADLSKYLPIDIQDLSSMFKSQPGDADAVEIPF
jgi:hypothetical protein